MAIASLTSRIDKVKVYAAGATITRIADLQLGEGEVPEHVEIVGLPLALDDSSVRVRVEAEGRTNSAIATDVRIGLGVPPRQDVNYSPTDEEVRQAKAEVQRLEDAIALIENEISVLYQLDVPKRPEGEDGKAPPPSPLAARLALANFKDEQVHARIQERQETQEKLRQAQEYLDNLLSKQSRASSAKEVRPNELRKTVIVRLSCEGESSTLEGQQLLIEYFVPGARWTPTYVCRLDSAGNSASIAVRALICQRSGEDWSGVRLELSTAEPMAWCELPELPSLRLGRAQPVLRKSGWRLPPVGAEILFEDFDRQKYDALAAVPQPMAIADIFPPSIPELPHLTEQFGKQRAFSGNAQQLRKDVLQADLAKNFLEHRGASAPPRQGSPRRSSPPAAARPVSRTYNDSLDEFDITLISPGMMIDEEIDEQESSSQIPIEEFSLSVRKPRRRVVDEFPSDRLAYGFMLLGAAHDSAKRGKLSIEQRQEVYLEILKPRNVVVSFDVMGVVQQAGIQAQNCINVNLPPGGINVRTVAGSFDYAYNADGRVDVSSDGQFHSVALTSSTTDVDLRYVVVPREDTNVFRIAQLKNPLQAPLLAGSADVYVDSEYILSTNITTVPPKGQMELGLGVEQAIKVARNTTYQEVRSGETLVAFNELRHQIQIDIANRLPREARIEVRERLPIPDENAKVDVQITRVSPDWEKYEQEERDAPIRGGYRWRVQVPAREQTTLSVQYTIKTFVDSELRGGNRRE